MQRYAAYRARVYALLFMATGVDARCLPPDALAALPDLYRAGLGIDDAADQLAYPGPERRLTRPFPQDPDNYPSTPQEER